MEITPAVKLAIRITATILTILAEVAATIKTKGK